MVIADDERDETLAASSERTAAHDYVDRSNTIGLATLPARTCMRARFPKGAWLTAPGSQEECLLGA